MAQSPSPRTRGFQVALGLFLCSPLFASGGGTSTAQSGAADPAAEIVDQDITDNAAKDLAAKQADGPMDPILGAPLVVNGEKIGLDEIKRQALLCSDQRVLLEQAKIQVYIDQEIERQIAEEGKTREDFVLDPDEIKRVIADNEQEVRESYDESVDIEHLMPSKQPDWYDKVYQTQLFKKIFLPENPYEYPSLTVEAFTAQTQAQADAQAKAQAQNVGPLPAEQPQQPTSMLDVLKAEWDRKQAEGAETTEPVETDPMSERMFDLMVTQTVLRHLKNTAEELGPEDGIPPHVAKVVNGVEITVDSIWEQIKDRITPRDVWKAKQFLVNTTLLRQALEEAGFLLSREEAAALWEEKAAPYRGGFFSYENMAVNIKKFPTLGMYLVYERLYESYAKMIEPEMTDEALRQHGIEHTSAIVSQSTVDVDIILVSAYDFEKKEWIEDGWAKAAAEATDIHQQLAAGADWDQMLETHSDFYDPPLPKQAVGNPDALKNRNRKGRFRGWIRNTLMTKLEDTEFLLFLNGNGLVEIIFFEMQIGSIEQPIRGPWGYYIIKLLNRTTPSKNLLPGDPKSRPYLVQDYIGERMRKFTNELLKTAKIQGMN